MRRAIPVEHRRIGPVECAAEGDLAAGELGASEADRATRELGSAEADRAAGKHGASETDVGIRELGACEVGVAARELGTRELNPPAGELSAEANPAAGKLGTDEANPAARERGSPKTDLGAREPGASEANVATGELGASELNPAAGEKSPPSKTAPVKSKLRPCQDSAAPSLRCAVMTRMTVCRTSRLAWKARRSGSGASWLGSGSYGMRSRRTVHRRRSAGLPPNHQPGPPWRIPQPAGRPTACHCPVCQQPYQAALRALAT